MLRTVRSLAAIAAAAVIAASFAGPALAAGPVRVTVDLDDPAWDADESAWATAECGFPVDAQVAGHWIFVVYPDDARHVVKIDHYATRVTYTNIATGEHVRLRDIGPDRTYLRDGRLYIGATGRAVTTWGNIGLVVIDLETGEVVFSHGNEVGLFYADLCARLA